MLTICVTQGIAKTIVNIPYLQQKNMLLWWWKEDAVNIGLNAIGESDFDRVSIDTLTVLKEDQ